MMERKKKHTCGAHCRALWLLFLFLPLLLPAHGAAAASNPELRLTRHVVSDPSSGGMTAMVVVTPPDWRFSGQAEWDAQSITYPGRVGFLAEGPTDGAQVRYFPLESYTYVTGRPVGQRMNGSTMLPAMSAEQYLRTLFQNARPQAANVTVNQMTRPDWLMGLLRPQVEAAQRNIQQAGMQGQSSGDAAEMAVTYTENGQRWEERLYVAILYDSIVLNTQMRPTFTGWTTTGVLSKRAFAGAYQKHQAAFEIIEKNATIEPEWFTAMALVGQQLIKRQQYEIQRGWQAAQDMIAAKRQINESVQEVIRERQESADRIHSMRMDSLMGIDRYESSAGNLALPSGYNHTWERRNGDIVMTDNPLFDPNNQNPGEWNKIPKIR